MLTSCGKDQRGHCTCSYIMVKVILHADFCLFIWIEAPRSTNSSTEITALKEKMPFEGCDFVEGILKISLSMYISQVM